MKEVILTVGPQGSGKTVFCNKAVTFDPNTVMVSRDEILVELFGSVFLDSYSGGHFHAHDVMWQRIEEKIQTSSNSRFILDTWNGNSQERIAIIKKLRALGVDRILAWYFVTPVKNVSEWFWMKPGVAKTVDWRNQQGQNLVFFSEDAPKRDHELFHTFASEIDLDPFDEVVRINPVVDTPEQTFNLQTSLKL